MTATTNVPPLFLSMQSQYNPSSTAHNMAVCPPGRQYWCTRYYAQTTFISN